MALALSPNINTLWCALIVEELIRNGINYFCISPGSRSAPLSLAVASNSKAIGFVHFDERGTAFHALGYASATQNPCVLICTSGTASANYYPAIIETSKKKVPLIILTADRPPELRFTGAHQTIDQVKMFGEYVRWSFDFPCPTKDIPPEFILTTIDQGISMAKNNLKGPIHINCMFREPLGPIAPFNKNIFSTYLKSIQKWQTNNSLYTQYIKPHSSHNTQDIKEIALKIKTIKSGIIVVGKLSNANDRKNIIQLAQKLNWPVFPDISSGLRLGHSHKNIIHHFDQILLSEKIFKKYKVDGILHLGGRITSKRWYEYIEKIRPQHNIMIINHPLRNDPLHQVTIRIQSPIASFCSKILKQFPQRKNNPLLTLLQKSNKIVNAVIDKNWQGPNDLNESMTARLITQYIPANSALFLASSMPIREVDMFGALDGKKIAIGSNRGASGIDGTIASASGFSNGLNKVVTLLIGDLTFLHDLNSLAMLHKLNRPMIIVVLNNNGGGIFSFLPIARIKKGFEKYLATPHHLTFNAAADMFDLNYVHPTTIDEFVKTYQIALKGTTSTLIEISSDRHHNVDIHQQIQKRIKNELDPL